MQASSIAPARRCGSLIGRLRAKPFGTPGKIGPAIFAFLCPKPPLGSFTKAMESQHDNALLALRKHSRVLRHRRASADCFGANPVASALGNRARRDPGTAVRTYHEGPDRPSKPELSTWLGIGTFYLAPTRLLTHL